MADLFAALGFSLVTGITAFLFLGSLYGIFVEHYPFVENKGAPTHG